MLALTRPTYGSVSVLRVSEVIVPEPGPYEVRVRVHAAGLTRSAWHLMTGVPYALRLFSGLRRPRNPRLGSEFAGVVDAIGQDVVAFKPGDAVFGAAAGSFAEYVVANEDRVAPKPPSLSFEEAAALPESGATALQAVRDHARTKAGDRVLVIGASGGVGTYAVQIAKALGATVTGSASSAKLDLVRSLGADHAFDYAAGVAPDGTRFDAIVDTGGNRRLSELQRWLKPDGRAVLVGGEGGRVVGPLGRSLVGALRSVSGKRKFITFLARVDRADLDQLAAMVAAGSVRPVVSRRYALDDAADAMRDLEAGRIRGKAVLTFAPSPPQ